jgi:Protein of unknown function (DUF4245)
VSQPQSDRPTRYRMSWRWTDVIRSLVVVLLLIGAVALYQSLLTDDPGDPTPAVDYQTAVTAAREESGYPVLAPADLPDGWEATSVRYTPGAEWAWHLGVLTADEEYVGLEQARIDPDSLIETAAEGTEPTGTTEIDGAAWQVRTDESRGETTLVREQQGVTTVVTGSASQETLEDYVRSLQG